VSVCTWPREPLQDPRWRTDVCRHRHRSRDAAEQCEKRENRRREREEEAAAAESASVYRCAPCGHGKHLTAWALFVIHGPLGADGHLTELGYDDEDLLFEDSIQCTKHPDEPIEKLVDGVWCRWWSCVMCGGTGRRGDIACSAPNPIGKHEGWRPAAEVGGPPVWPGLGAGHVLDQDLRFYQPGGEAPNCRICGSWADSIAGGEPCEGNGHRCPAVVPGQEASPDALPRRGRDDWFCGRPGSMSEDFTSWTCTAGHVCGPDHAESEAVHERECIPGPRGCPWKYLAREQLVSIRDRVGEL
jgi:hypothetical protein